jgi:hypothetical protein
MKLQDMASSASLTFEQLWQLHRHKYLTNLLARQQLGVTETQNSIEQYDQECLQFFQTVAPYISTEQWQSRMHKEAEEIHVIALSAKDLEFLLKQKTRYHKDLIKKQADRGVLEPKVDPILIWDLKRRKLINEPSDL